MLESEAALIIDIAKKAEREAWKYDVLDDEKCPRLAPAVRALRESYTLDVQRISHAVAMATMLQASDLQIKTCAGLIRDLVKAGALIKEGEYIKGNRRKRGRDERMYSWGEW